MKRRRGLRILLLSPLVLMMLALIALHLFSGFGLSETEIREAFAAAGVPYVLEERNGITFVETGNPEGPPLLFIHGSPGSWDNFLHYLLDESLRESYRMIAVNRPGYGGLTVGKPEPSLQRQAEAALEAVSGDKPVVVIGHSMGGPIAVKAAMMHEDRIRGLVLLSAALDPDLEQVKGIQHVGALPLISSLLPASLDVCNRELIPLKEELERMSPGWRQLSVPMIAVHGDQDSLVPVENMTFLSEQVAPEYLEVRILKGANHFIPWTHEDEVERAILDLN